MGIPDEESWFKTHLLPTGTARGWRRTGCLAMLIGALVLLTAAAVVGVLTSSSSDDGDDRIVRRYGDAIGPSSDELELIRQEAVELANEICLTEPSNFVELWDSTSIGADVALDIAEIHCPDEARAFAEDGYEP